MLVQKAGHGVMEELLKLLGFSTPLIYAGAAYGFFLWLDKEASDEAKAALARTMRLKDYKNEQVASALVEVFDRIYTHPLLHWRAFRRSAVFTFLLTLLWIIEIGFATKKVWVLFPFGRYSYSSLFKGFFLSIFLAFLTNAVTDYVSLFVIRRWLGLCGARPIFALITGTLISLIIVFVGILLRDATYVLTNLTESDPILISTFFSIPAFAVFLWLPLFALGIVIVRLLTPLSWIVGRTQWFLKEGKEHPLKAIGYVAAVVVFLGTVAARAVFSA
jgi:hypothetical protein